MDDVGHRYEQMVPEYPIKEAVMRSLICMFDSGYTLPQGREVINYFYPLQYGYDGLIKMCEEGIAETAGRPDGDGIIGMSRLYFYEAVKLGEIDGDVFAAVRRRFNEKNRRAGTVLSKTKRDAAVGFVNALGIIRSCLEEILGDRI